MVMVMLFVLGGGLFVYSAWQALTYKESAENVTTVDWLPKTASRISYFKSYMFTAFEFDIPEADFLQWCKEEGWPVTKVELRETIDKCFVSRWNNGSVTIEGGWYYEHRQKNGGGVWVGYQRETGRAYYSSAPR
jgi:hypothetical protein